MDIRIDGPTLDTLIEMGVLVQCAQCDLYISEGVATVIANGTQPDTFECSDCDASRQRRGDTPRAICYEVVTHLESLNRYVCLAQWGTEHTHAELTKAMRLLGANETVFERDDCIFLEVARNG